jgi:hypothetical protein
VNSRQIQESFITECSAEINRVTDVLVSNAGRNPTSDASNSGFIKGLIASIEILRKIVADYNSPAIPPQNPPEPEEKETKNVYEA